MVNSACAVLHNEPERFVNYLIADSRVRNRIYDNDSFVKELERVMKSDPALSNIVDHIKSTGLSLSNCAENIFSNSDIQRLVQTNNNTKRKELRNKVKRQYPNLKGKALVKEIDRRFNISKGVSKTKPLKQITIQEATTPIKVSDYFRNGLKVKGVSRTKARDLSTQEKMLITNFAKKSKGVNQTIKEYYNSGLPYRTPVSIKRHYYRIKRKIK